MHTSGFINKNDISLFYEEFGDRNNPPLILLHGFPFSGKMWSPNVTQLAKYFRVIVPDLRGHGKSSIGTAHYTIDTFAEDTLFLMNYLNISKAHICGLSMGGYIAIRMYQLSPTSITTLILADTKALADNNSAKLARYENIKLIESGKIDVFIKRFLPALFSDETIDNHAEHLRFIDSIIIENNPIGIIGTLLALASRLDQSATICDIEVPTLLICGEHDEISTPKEMEKMADYIPNNQWIIVPKAGHLSNIEQPEIFNASIINFFSLLQSTPLSVNSYRS